MPVNHNSMDLKSAYDLLGVRVNAPMAAVKKHYRQKAMVLHPDRNNNDKANEERLKKVNAAYAVIVEAQRSAKARDAEDDAVVKNNQPRKSRRAENAKPKEGSAKPKSAGATPKRPRGMSDATKKYMAAAVPRSMRVARLSYLPIQVVIGSKITKKPNDLNLIFDIIVLPEKQFIRARSYLATPDLSSNVLQYVKFTPPYILRDIKEIKVPASEEDPEAFAASHFKKQFKL